MTPVLGGSASFAAVAIASSFQSPYTPSCADGTIKKYKVRTSLDGKTFGAAIASGTWADAPSLKSVDLAPVRTRFIRLEDEIRSVGVVIDRTTPRGPDAYSDVVKITWDAVNEVETVVSGDATRINSGPIPLVIDLSSL